MLTSSGWITSFNDTGDTMNKPSIRWKVFGLIVTAIMALLCTAGIHVDAERHAMTLASMDVPQLLSYALVIFKRGDPIRMRPGFWRTTRALRRGTRVGCGIRGTGLWITHRARPLTCLR